MKKIIKMLSCLFLLGGASNLACSQNVRTLATNCCCEAAEVDNNKIRNVLRAGEKVRQQLLKENGGVLLEVKTKNDPTLASYFQLAHIFISEDLLNINRRSENKVSIKIVNENNEEYIDNDAVFAYRGFRHEEPRYINNFAYFTTLSDRSGYDKSGVLYPETESVDENFNFEVGKEYTIIVSVNGEEVLNQKVKAIERINSSNVKQLTNKAKKQNAKVNKAKKIRSHCLYIPSDMSPYKKMLQQFLKNNDGIAFEIDKRGSYMLNKLSINCSEIDMNEDEFLNDCLEKRVSLKIIDENGKQYVNNPAEIFLSCSKLGEKIKSDNFFFTPISVNFNENLCEVDDPETESVDEDFNFKVGKTYTIIVSVNDEEVLNQQVKAIKKIENYNVKKK